MKVSEQTRFPHPVLSKQTGDYQGGEFSVKLSVAEVPDKARVTLDYAVTLTEPRLHELVTSGDAGVGVFVGCRDTYYRRLAELGLESRSITFEPGSLIGRVAIRPLIWARKPISGFPLDNCHPEFGAGDMDFPAGAVLALDQESIINVGREKLAQMETIFAIAKSPELPANTLSVGLDSDRIRILVAQNVYDTVNTLRGLGHGRPVILNSVYLPAVMQVLDSLREGAAAYEGRRWYRVFSAKCDYYGVDLENPDLWRDAQTLLEAPFSEIHNNKEILGA